MVSIRRKERTKWQFTKMIRHGRCNVALKTGMVQQSNIRNEDFLQRKRQKNMKVK